MSVYSKDGALLSAVYNKNGELLQKAYDSKGQEIFSAGQKAFSIIGDSYSTFVGDVYPSTNGVWYDGQKTA